MQSAQNCAISTPQKGKSLHALVMTVVGAVAVGSACVVDAAVVGATTTGGAFVVGAAEVGTAVVGASGHNDMRRLANMLGAVMSEMVPR